MPEHTHSKSTVRELAPMCIVRWTPCVCCGIDVHMAGKSQKPKQTQNAQSREDRLKAALKQNLARRKAQAKARDQNKDEQNG